MLTSEEVLPKKFPFEPQSIKILLDGDGTRPHQSETDVINVSKKILYSVYSPSACIVKKWIAADKKEREVLKSVPKQNNTFLACHQSEAVKDRC